MKIISSYFTPAAAVLAALLAVTIAGCADAGDDARIVVRLWHTQRGDNQAMLETVIEGFNSSQDEYRVVPQYVGSYDQSFRRMSVAIRGGRPPALVVAYESMVAKYHEAGAVVDLDEYLTHPEYGLSEDNLADIYPAFIKCNRFTQYDNKLLSFPFTKSILMMYYNRGLLEELGFEPPPATWSEFAEMCRAARRAGKRGYALSVDASSFDAMVYSYGGDVIDVDKMETLLDRGASLRVLEMIDMMIGEGLAYIVEKGDDRSDLASGRAAFMIRSSTHQPTVKRIADELKAENQPYADWDLDIIPHDEDVGPVTVMFGANICMLKTSPEVQHGAWEFIKYFTSTEVTAEWAKETGYLPVRKSATDTEVLREFYAADPRSRKPLDALPFAVNEPTVTGWQEIRNYIASAKMSVISRNATVEETARQLAGKSNRLLQEIHGGQSAEAPWWFAIVFVGVGVASIGTVWRMRHHLVK